MDSKKNGPKSSTSKSIKDNKIFNNNIKEKKSFNNYKNSKDHFFKKFKKKANYLLQENHNSNELSIFKKIANDIVYNEKSHITAVFKDFLIYDDYSEFMKR